MTATEKDFFFKKEKQMGEFLKYEISPQSHEEGRASTDARRRSPGGPHWIDIGAELDRLFPAKPGTENDESVTLRASRQEARPFEIYQLADDLDGAVKRLEREHAGFSDPLKDVHQRFFDELIRQEVIACPERGLMWADVRDEMSRTLESMRELRKSCFAYAATKDLLTRKDMLRMQKEVPKRIQEIDGFEKRLRIVRSQWQERKGKLEEEDYIRGIERTFVEDQLILSNRQMSNQIEDVIDAEHKWLEDLD